MERDEAATSSEGVGDIMKMWSIQTVSSQPVYRTYWVKAETEEDARRLYYNGEADPGDVDYGDEDDERIDTVEMEEDLTPEDQQLDEGI